MFYRVIFLICAMLVLGQAVEFETAKTGSDRLNERFFYRLAKKISGKSNIHPNEASGVHEDAVTTNSLRRVEDESRFMSGIVSLADYNDFNCYFFNEFSGIVLNKCQNVRDWSFRVRAWTTQNNHLGITFDEWDQNNCVGYWYKEDVYVPYGLGCWAGSRGEVTNSLQFSNDLPPSKWRPAFATYFFPNQGSCQTAHDTGCETHDYSGWEEVDIHSIGHCYHRSEGDVVFTGCNTPNGVGVDIFQSNNGTCTNFVKRASYNPGNVCIRVDVWGRDSWPDYTLNRCFY